MALTGEEVDPFALGEVYVTLVVRTHNWGYKHLAPEVILVRDVPACPVVWMVHQQSLYDRPSTLCGMTALLDDIRHEAVSQFPPFLHNIGHLRIIPWLALV